MAVYTGVQIAVYQGTTSVVPKSRPSDRPVSGHDFSRAEEPATGVGLQPPEAAAKEAAEKLSWDPKMALTEICNLLILRSSGRHFGPISVSKKRFSAASKAAILGSRGFGTTKVAP